MNAITSALLGAVSLFFGRRLFWLFVALVGFAAGFTVADRFLVDAATWLVVLVGLVAGFAGAVLALVAQRLAIAVAGFFAGAYLFLYVAEALGGGNGGIVDTVALILGGVLGAILLSALFDVGLIVASSLVGGILIAQAAMDAFDLGSTVVQLGAIVLAIIGIVVQWSAWQRREAGTREEPVA